MNKIITIIAIFSLALNILLAISLYVSNEMTYRKLLKEHFYVLDCYGGSIKELDDYAAKFTMVAEGKSDLKSLHEFLITERTKFMK